MRRIALVFLGLVTLGCSTKAPVADLAAYTALGEWRQAGEAQWRFAGQGVAAGPAEKTGFLVSPGRYRNVTITAEFWIEDDTNSGMFVRCKDPATLTPFDCYEVNIWDNHPQQENRTGSIVTRQSPLAHVDTLGKWNRCRIELRGDTIMVTINDVLTARLVDDQLREGHIALQYAGKGLLRFRNVRLSVD
ncbi:MAG: DUF1080 domain-containing protein [Gammaproteobacteria bacterium]|nr:DUF1080 domain-containing protein [Gammaproteobacteria bacterium]